MKPLFLALLLVSCGKTEPTARPVGLKIGDVKFGGIIFYVSGDHGLVASAVDQSSSVVWYDSGGYKLVGTDMTNGTINTASIVSILGPGNHAAFLCADLDYNGYTDWYLPSKDELNLLYISKIFTADAGYWSSSENDSINAWVQAFNNGFQAPDHKYAKYRVRAIRAF